MLGLSCQAAPPSARTGAALPPWPTAGLSTLRRRSLEVAAMQSLEVLGFSDLPRISEDFPRILPGRLDFLGFHLARFGWIPLWLGLGSILA